MSSLTDLIDKVFVEHGSSIVQSKHIAMLKDQIVMLEKENVMLRSKNAELTAENEYLKSELANYENAGDNGNDVCKYCGKISGQLLSIEPDPVFGDLGIETYSYKCLTCGKEYKRNNKR